jgi:hypothetical protein
MLRTTFFEQFCGGENVDDLRCAIERLRCDGKNVRSILDYAVEDDAIIGDDDVDDVVVSGVVGCERDDDDDDHRMSEGAEYDRRREAYSSCVRMARDVSLSDAAPGNDDVRVEGGGGGMVGGGCAAIKVTALCDPTTLERVSNAIRATRELYVGVFDVRGMGSITREEFARRYELSPCVILFIVILHSPFSFETERSVREQGALTSFFHLLLLQFRTNEIAPFPKTRRYFHVHDVGAMDVLDLMPRHTASSGDDDDDGAIDCVSFGEVFTPYTLMTYASRCRDANCTALLTSDMPTDVNIVLFDKTWDRLRDLVEEAAMCGTRLLVDAEHCKYQPAIDYLVLKLQREYNVGDRPVVFNTYQVSVSISKFPVVKPYSAVLAKALTSISSFEILQCYLKDAQDRVMTDLKRSERFGYHFAAKIVRGKSRRRLLGMVCPTLFRLEIPGTSLFRTHCHGRTLSTVAGAYMVHERDRAALMKYEDPIHETAERTHRCYDAVIEHLLRHRCNSGPGSEIMIATHNETSIRKAVDLMGELGLIPNDECVHFAQLYGMSDHLTFALGRNGYNAYKYLPYGKVREVIPYLVRRAQENGDVLGNTGTELRLLHEELLRRCSIA